MTGIHPDDRERVRASVTFLLDNLSNYEMTYRYITRKGNLKWIRASMEVVRHEDGTATSYSTYTDLTEQIAAQRQLSDVVQTVPCGICLYRYDGKRLIPLLANAQLSEMLGVDAVTHLAKTGGLNYTMVHPDDIDELMRASKEALRETHVIDCAFRVRNQKTGLYRWIRERGRLTVQPDGSQLAYLTYFDVTEEHRAQQRIRESERTLEYAADMAGLWCWTYDPAQGLAYMDARSQRDFGLPPVMRDFPDSWLARGIIHPDHIASCRDAFARAVAGEDGVQVEGRYVTCDGALHWARFRLALMPAEDDAAPTVLCTAIPIDAERELLTKYELERKKPSLGEENLLVHALFDLTTGETLEYAYQNGDVVPDDERTAFTGDRDHLDALLIDDGERERYRALYDPAFLMRRYENGEGELSIDYRRRLRTGDVIWVRNILHLVRDPNGGDILLFAYCYAIEDEKTRELMYRSLAAENYDYVVRVDLRSRRFDVVNKPEYSHLPIGGTTDADEVSRQLVESVVPEDREETLRRILVQGIRENLRDAERFEFTSRFVERGEIRHKKLTQYYIDRQREIAVMLCEDVTALIAAEQRKNAALADALDAANAASRAKSQFLSRMSHELRTPMNAIIGLASLAESETDNAAVMADTIGKIGLSARYLLSLINDILEMSRIESGRMTLNEAAFGFEEWMRDINNIICGQAAAKGVAYETVIDGEIAPAYVGDAMKLKQVLINVLGNAVKFTPMGGSVRFSVSQLARAGERATVRFTVRDTGIGMESDFLARVFDPFAQESMSFTSTSTGTGLGLAIAKSMVDMMDGGIDVQSAPGKGSTFVIDVRLGLIGDGADALVGKPHGAENNPADAPASDLTGRRVLLAEDHPLNVEVARRVLEKYGASVTVASNGLEAVEAFGRAPDSFDAILMDVRMPIMDGLTAATRIRESGVPRAKTVPIVAMTANAFDEDVRQSLEHGMNAHLTKPIDPALLVGTLYRLIAERE